MSDWIMLVPSFVLSEIKNKFSQEIMNDLGMTGYHFSTTDKSNSKALFPFIYISTLNSSEIGETLDGQDINGGTFAFQIDVYDSQSQYRARKVMGEVVRIMKSMRFRVTLFPEFNNDDVYRCIARFERTIGASNTL